MAARTDVELDFGGTTRREIQAALAEAGVLTNEFADHLLALNVFDDVPTGYVDIAFVTAATVHPQGPASFTTLMRAARAAGFKQPPIECAPWLRLAVDQDDAPDSDLSAGHSPSGAVVIASAPVDDDDDFPKGFYLRRVDGSPWLRGHRFTDEYLFPPETVFALAVAREIQR